MSNGAASEIEVGVIHQKVTTIINKGLDRVLKNLDSEDEVTAMLAAEAKVVDKGIKWVELNKITAVLEADRDGSALKSKLDEIKAKQQGKTIGFHEPGDDE